MFGAIFEHNNSVLSLIIIVVWFSIFFVNICFIYDFDISLVVVFVCFLFLFLGCPRSGRSMLRLERVWS